MKTYNIMPWVIQMGTREITAVVLGEVGRGRRKTIVPCPCPEREPFLRPDTTRSGRTCLTRDSSEASNCGWIARICTYGGYKRDAYGYVATYPESTIKVIAAGWGAFGGAGRVGRWRDYVLEVPDHEFLKVKETGRRAYLLHFTPEGVTRYNQEEVGLDDVLLPAIDGNWKDITL